MTGTVVLTGITGYIAKHIAVTLLNEGHSVRGTLRRPGDADGVRAALRPHLHDATSLERLAFAQLDLTDDTGWNRAMAGADALVHTASPFPLEQPKTDGAIVETARGGTLRALRAAERAGIARVVITSSSGAVSSKAAPDNGIAFTEDDWSDPDFAGTTPYYRSKIAAERAAWDFADATPDMALTVINPVFVMGPPLDGRPCTSVRFVRRILKGRDPMHPRVGFLMVDARDVARAHVAALTRPDSAGKRVLVADRFLWFSEIAAALQTGVPGRRIVRPIAPDIAIRAFGFFDRGARIVVPLLGREDRADTTRMRALLGVEPRDVREALGEMARHLA